MAKEEWVNGLRRYVAAQGKKARQESKRAWRKRVTIGPFLNANPDRLEYLLKNHKRSLKRKYGLLGISKKGSQTERAPRRGPRAQFFLNLLEGDNAVLRIRWTVSELKRMGWEQWPKEKKADIAGRTVEEAYVLTMDLKTQEAYAPNRKYSPEMFEEFFKLTYTGKLSQDGAIDNMVARGYSISHPEGFKKQARKYAAKQKKVKRN